MTVTRKPPTGLGHHGRMLWRETLAVYELDPAEQAILREMCRCTDELDKLERAARQARPTALGAAGQTVAHPIFNEVRQHRENLRKLAAALDLSGADARAAPVKRRNPNAKGRMTSRANVSALVRKAD